MRLQRNGEPTRAPASRALGERFMALVGVVVLLSLLVEYGFHLGAGATLALEILDVSLAGVFGTELVLSLVRGPTLRATARRRWFEVALLLVFVGALAALGLMAAEHRLPDLLRELHVRSAAKAALALVQIYVLLTASLRLVRAHEDVLGRSFRPETLLVGGFGLLVVTGALLLSLPRSAAGAPLSLLDAFFTATSAVCVTGLTVVDTGQDLSLLGQTVLLGLIQIGGLGIMTFVAFGSILAGRSFDIPQMVVLREVVNARNLADVRRQIAAIVLFALAIELLGAALLFLGAPSAAGSGAARAGWSLFHAVSAFCNAGFALQSDSLVSMRGLLGVNAVVMGLVVLGGLGIPVVRELGRWTQHAARKRLQRRSAPEPLPRMSLQTRLSLLPTGILLVVGVLGFLLLEQGNTLAGRSASEMGLVAAFQSVTARTAGFNTVEIGGLRDATLVLVIFLMVIGASPVSTGGGIKTVTFAVLLLTVRSMLTGKERVEAFGRTLSRRVVHAAISIFVLYVLTAYVAVFLLAVTDPEMLLQDQVFEVLSALSTVGLSTGITAEFSAPGKLVLCALMFIGRVGPLTLVLDVFHSRTGRSSYQYPEESVVTG